MSRSSSCWPGGARAVFEYGSSRGEEDVARLTQSAAGLKSVLEKERQAVRELRQKLAVAERGSEINKAAVEDARSELKDLQNQKLALEKQVVFLRRLVSTVGGWCSQRARLEAGTPVPGRVHRYAFTISQPSKDFVSSEGTVEISLSGARDGQPHTLRLPDETKPPVRSLSMRFRHFQLFEGELHIPGDFSPEQIFIEVKPKSEKWRLRRGVSIGEPSPSRYRVVAIANTRGDGKFLPVEIVISGSSFSLVEDMCGPHAGVLPDTDTPR